MQDSGGETQRTENRLQDLGVDGRIILKWNLKKYDGMAWTELIWLRIGFGGRLLDMWQWTFGFHKKKGNFVTS
jgi:hypothetical protein